MADLVFHTLTDEQFRAIITDRDQAVEREKRNLELAENIYRQYISLLSGLKHFSREEVAELLHCSEHQLYRYEKDNKLVPRRMLGKILYPGDRLLEFLRTYDQPAMAAEVQSHVSSFPTRKRTH